MNSGVWVPVVIYAFGGGGFFFKRGGGRGGEGRSHGFFSGGREGNQLLPQSIKRDHRKLTAY